MNFQRSFTLIELLVVIAIIGILASVVLVSMEGAEDRAVTGKAMEFSHIVRVSLGADLTGEWRFDDGSDPTRDSSGYDNHGDLLPIGLKPTYTNEGIFGKALVFSGNYVEIPDSESLNIADEITVEAWVKPSSYNNSLNSIVQKWGDTSDRRQYQLTISNNKVRWYISTAGTNWPSLTSDQDIPLSQWSHIVGTYDKNNLRIYINGSLDKEGVQTGSIFVSDIYGRIGGYGSDGEYSSDRYFNGIIDEVRIYNRALSSAEIQQRYVAGISEHNIVLK